MRKSGFMIGAPTSGTGKTTVSLGVMRALSDRGLTVAPFKTGPDYIDTQYHAVAAERPSVNLDTFFAPEDELRRLFAGYSQLADVAVVEGAMGLFDGYDRDRGSSADVARTLGIPVVLVVNAKSTSYSLAPLLRGFRDFDPGVSIRSVIFNRVGSTRHLAMVSAAAADAGLHVAGALPASSELMLPSRHLGLTLGQRNEMDLFADVAARVVRENVDLDTLLSLDYELSSNDVKHVAAGTLNIAVARDMAFSFIYQTTLDAFSRIGRVTFFSPLTDDELPADTDILYLPGGYPELYASQLSGNRGMLSSIRNYVAAGGRVLAECGGLIYLCKSVVTADGCYPMCQVLPMTATMDGARLRLGYRQMELGGMHVRGHEFHYSRLDDGDVMPGAALMRDAVGNVVDTRVYRYKNVIAGYTHLYLGNIDIEQLWNR